MTQFLTQNSPIPSYMVFPRFLLDKDGLNETAKILYTILLDRARLSKKNDGWTDEQGHVFIFFPIKSLAETMHKSEMSVKTALNALEKENLVARKRQGAGFPNRIYVKYPPEALNQTDRNLSVRQTENCPIDGKKTVSVTDSKLSSSNKEKNNIKRTKSESKDDRTAYGSYENVFLSMEELISLRKEVPHYAGSTKNIKFRYLISQPMVLDNSPVSTQINDRLRSELYLHHLHRITVPPRYQKGDFMANNRPMTEDEKKLLQAQHRMEAIEARNRQKERKARTRRLIQMGAVLESVFPKVQTMELDDVKMELKRRLNVEE